MTCDTIPLCNQEIAVRRHLAVALPNSHLSGRANFTRYIPGYVVLNAVKAAQVSQMKTVELSSQTLRLLDPSLSQHAR
jgi:hypothetical protein